MTDQNNNIVDDFGLSDQLDSMALNNNNNNNNRRRLAPYQRDDIEISCLIAHARLAWLHSELSRAAPHEIAHIVALGDGISQHFDAKIADMCRAYGVTPERVDQIYRSFVNTPEGGALFDRYFQDAGPLFARPVLRPVPAPSLQYDNDYDELPPA